MRYRNCTGIADSLIKGSFELSCTLLSSGKTECSYARITDKMKCKNNHLGEQKQNKQKDKSKRCGGNYRPADGFSESVFLLTFVTTDKSKCPPHR